MTGSVPDTAEINDNRDDKPQNVDASEGHGIVNFPSVNNGGDGKEDEAKNGQEQLMVKSALQIVGEEPHQQKYDAWKKQHQENEEARHTAAMLTDSLNGNGAKTS